MRKAKTAAVIFGGVATCLFGGLLAVYATAPVVSIAGPENSVEIYDVKNEEFANSAAFTSIRTTAVTTSSKVTTTTKTTSIKANVYYATLDVNKVTSTAPAETTEAATEAVPMTTTVAYIEPTINNTEAEQAPAPAPVNEESVYDYYYSDNTDANAVAAEPATEAPAVQPAPVEPVVEAVPAVETVSSGLPITDSEFILLCNAVANEAGSSWISEYDKALVVEVIMNRVNDPRYPGTIYGVITQPYQFSGSSSYSYLDTFSGYVTESVKNAVRLYFNDTGSFTQGYLSFTGNGYSNTFA